MTNVYHKNLTGDNLHIPKTHASSHQNGETDEINVSGLVGRLSEDQFTSIAFINDIPGLINTILTDHNVSAHNILNINASSIGGYAPTKFMLLDGTQAMTGDLNISAHKIINLTTPTTDYDAVTKKYADDIIGGGTIRSTATYIVSASDAKNTSRGDYLCDGVSDEVEIQAAVDILPSSGGTIYLSEGTFNISQTIYLKDNICMRGSGFGTILSGNTTSFPTGIGSGGVFKPIIANISRDSVIGNKNIMISDLSMLRQPNSSFNTGLLFYYASPNSTEPGVTVKNCKITLFPWNIYLDYSSMCMIINNYLEDGDGVNCNHSQWNNVINGNIINNFGDNGILMKNGCFGFTVSNNVINGSGDQIGVSGICIETGRSRYNTVVGNYITTCERDGITLAGGTPLDCRYNSVIGNIIRNIGKTGEAAGIYISESATYNIINGNVIEDCPSHGISTQTGDNNDNVISNNIIKGCGWGDGNYYGIDVYYGTRNLVQGNLIRLDANGSTKYGIYSAAGNLVINNDNMSSGYLASFGGSMNTGPGNRENTGNWTTGIC